MRIEQSINRKMTLNADVKIDENRSYNAIIDKVSDNAIKVSIVMFDCRMMNVEGHVIEFKASKRVVRYDENSLYFPEWLSRKNNIDEICKLYNAQGCSILKSIQNEIKCNLLKKAHQIAREYRSNYNSYKEAFKVSLELVYA